MVSSHDDALVLVPSRHEAWRRAFDSERDRIRDALAARSLDDSVVRLEHVGSTAVPDLPAKDIVDVDLVVADDAVTAVSESLVDALGGSRVENRPGWHPVFRAVDGQRFNVHVFGASDDGWKTSVAMRDVLRAHTDLREEYEALKRRLASETATSRRTRSARASSSRASSGGPGRTTVWRSRSTCPRSPVRKPRAPYRSRSAE